MPNRLYRMFHVAEFEIDSARRAHWFGSDGPSDKRIDAEVMRLVDDIEKNGLRNPLFVTMYADFSVIHPGKCRAKALKLLGHDVAPAIIYAPEGQAYPNGRELTPDDAAKHFSDDIVCEYDSRFFAAKRKSRFR